MELGVNIPLLELSASALDEGDSSRSGHIIPVKEPMLFIG
jgi:hypothetical protein